MTLALLPRRDHVDLDDAEAFLEQFHAETSPEYPLRRRLRRVRAEVERTGTYVHTEAEVTFGARVAWRNAARCIGRLYWHGLHVRDRRAVHTPSAVADECAAHLRSCTRGGRIRSTITVFAPDRPDRPGPRILNDQLVRYAGHRLPTGGIRGDRAQVAFTERAIELGWRPPDPPGRFDILPLLITSDGAAPEAHELPRDVVLEVPLVHPEFEWFADLRLRWHAVPAISNMPLSIGGITYPAAPFNGWYVGTEIGARNLADADRYDLLPAVAERMGLSCGPERDAVARSDGHRARAGGAALVRRGGRDDVRPPRGVPALPQAPRQGGAVGAGVPGGLELDRAAGVGRSHPGVPPLLRPARSDDPACLPPAA